MLLDLTHLSLYATVPYDRPCILRALWSLTVVLRAADRALFLISSSRFPRQSLMASIHTDSMALRRSIEIPPDRLRGEEPPRSISNTNSNCNRHIDVPPDQRMELERAEQAEAGEPPSQQNCDAHHDPSDPRIALSSTRKLAGQTIAPFLARHIPQQYAPLGVQSNPAATLFKDPNTKDPNTKYCYRHRPDSKCRRTADEPTMENLQRVC